MYLSILTKLFFRIFSKNTDKELTNDKSNSPSKRANSGARKSKKSENEPSSPALDKNSKKNKKGAQPAKNTKNNAQNNAIETEDTDETEKPAHPDCLAVDENLQNYHEDIKSSIKYNHTMQDQVRIIGDYVSDGMSW